MQHVISFLSLVDKSHLWTATDLSTLHSTLNSLCVFMQVTLVKRDTSGEVYLSTLVFKFKNTFIYCSVMRFTSSTTQINMDFSN